MANSAVKWSLEDGIFQAAAPGYPSVGTPLMLQSTDPWRTSEIGLVIP